MYGGAQSASRQRWAGFFGSILSSCSRLGNLTSSEFPCPTPPPSQHAASPRALEPPHEALPLGLWQPPKPPCSQGPYSMDHDDAATGGSGDSYDYMEDHNLDADDEEGQTGDGDEQPVKSGGELAPALEVEVEHEAGGHLQVVFPPATLLGGKSDGDAAIGIGSAGEEYDNLVRQKQKREERVSRRSAGTDYKSRSRSSSAGGIMIVVVAAERARGEQGARQARLPAHPPCLDRSLPQDHGGGFVQPVGGRKDGAQACRCGPGRLRGSPATARQRSSTTCSSPTIGAGSACRVVLPGFERN
jgi:hypothetical protein